MNTIKSSGGNEKEPDLNIIADLISKNMSSEEESQQQEKQKQLMISRNAPNVKKLLVGVPPGGSTGEWIGSGGNVSNTFNTGETKSNVDNSTTSTTTAAVTTTTGSPSSSSTMAVVTETQTELYNINGLTSTLKHLSLSPKTVSLHEMDKKKEEEEKGVAS